MALAQVTLDDKYAREFGRIYLNGTQALVRLLLAQKQRDKAAGLHTAGFVSGYRGSPLGGFDRELWRAGKALAQADVHFWPGINEDLAATAVWGTQMTHLDPAAKFDGVFGMWYGKGAGLDRCGDVMRHAHGSGTSPNGGVLAVVGDDHAQKSSTLPYHSEPTFADLLMPVLSPASVAEMLDYGLLGWAMSRYSGAWVGLKTLAEFLDCSVSIDANLHALKIRMPEDFELPAGAVHMRWPDPWHEQEPRIVRYKLEAAQAFARANRIDRIALDSPHPRLGILTTGKSYGDLVQAMSDLGLGGEEAAELGLRIYKVGMPWPLERSGLPSFAEGLDEILVIEEKRPLLETQLKDELYDRPVRPKVTGKKDESGRWQFPWIGECNPDRIARVLVERLAKQGRPALRQRIAVLDRQEKLLRTPRPSLARPPYFCSGCPHNTSTKVPDGSRAIAGVGCHYMAVSMDRATSTFSHMGGEGATWIGQAPFTGTDHVFVNLGEGTYFHSGSLAVRACIAAGVSITYKLLFNDAVAMTGGQPVDGQLTVPQLTRQLYAEGIRGIRVVTDEPEKYPTAADFAPGTTVHHRDELDRIQRELREIKGVTALVYDQTCAAEKRRRRKRKEMMDPPKRVFINDLVCEGCGDCSKTSNCLSVVPVETEFGRKRAIDQSSCNKDFSCIEGFCPSFVTVEGGTLLRPRPTAKGAGGPVPEPMPTVLDRPYNIFITGVGGTGVVTIGALLGMAAHFEGKSCAVLDQLGMAQKGGAVVTHIRIGASEEELPSVRVPTAGADLILGCDLAVAAQSDTIGKIAPEQTHLILNTHETITGAFTRDPDLAQPTTAMVEALSGIAGSARTEAFDATSLATRLMGDSVATNLFMLGYAYQKGLIPVAGASLVRAIELNGVAVAANIETFDWGRLAAFDRAAVEAAASPSGPRAGMARGLDEIVARRVEFLTAYQNVAYARRYSDAVAAVAVAEAAQVPGEQVFAETAARALFKLMAYKDEYEVARLHAESGFLDELRRQFDGDIKIRFHMAPPLLAERDETTGHLKKRSYGPWIRPAFRLLARLRALRGTPLDIFGRTAERRLERRLIEDYLALLPRLTAALDRSTHALAVEIAGLPLAMRGFGHVKEAAVKAALERQEELLGRLEAPSAPSRAAE